MTPTTMRRLLPSAVAPLPGLLLVFQPVPALAQSLLDRDWWWHMGWGFGPMMFGGLMMLVFWGAIILLIVLLVRWLALGDGSPRQPPRPTALDILQERFARGEIDKQEYEERRRLLRE